MNTAFLGESEGTCESCGTQRLLDSETNLCKDCWREWRNDQEEDDFG